MGLLDLEFMLNGSRTDIHNVHGLSLPTMTGICVVAMLVIICGMVVASDHSDATVVDNGSCGTNVTWELNDRGDLVISGQGAMTNWANSGTVPWNGVKSSIRSVTIESGVTSVGSYAFYACTNLTSVTIPDSVTSIGQSAFVACNGIKELTMPISLSVHYEQQPVFSGCEGIERITLTPGNGTGLSYIQSRYMETPWYLSRETLTEFNLSPGITSIGDNEFIGCSHVRTLVIPNTVSSIGQQAFSMWNSMVSLTIGSSVSSIGSSAFNYSYNLFEVINLSNVYLGSGSPDYGLSHAMNIVSSAQDATVTKTDDGFYYGTNGGKYYLLAQDGPVSSLELPAALNSSEYIVKSYAFHGKNVTNLIVPEAVTKIEYMAFGDCNSLTALHIANSETEIQNTAFPRSFYDFDGTTELQLSAVGGNHFKASGEGFTRCGSITFETNGGSEIDTCIDLPGTAVSAPATPTREHYIFAGWFADSGLGTPYQFTTVPQGFQTVYAKWEPVSYSVTFISDNQTFHSYSEKYGNVVHLPASDPVKESDNYYDYSFSGWVGYSENMTVNGNMQFTAAFNQSLRNYTVIFNSNGTEYYRTTLHFYDQIVKPSDPSKPSDNTYDYSFTGWEGYTENMRVSGNHTFTATFDTVFIEYTVKFVSEGSTYSTHVLHYGNAIIAPAVNPSKVSDNTYDYRFDGWDGYATNVTVTESVTYNAVFTPIYIDYTMTFLVDGIAYASIVGHYNDLVMTPADPTKSSDGAYEYSFEGWNGYADNMRITESVTFTAVFGKTLKVEQNGNEYRVNVPGTSAEFTSDLISDMKTQATSDSSRELSVSMGEGKIVFDNAALKSLSATDANLTMVKKSAEELSPAVKELVGNGMVFEVSFGSNTAFGDGKLTITVPYMLQSGEDGNHLSVWYISGDSVAEKIPCTYADGQATFETNHLSTYAVVFEAPPAEDSNMIMFAAIGAIAAVFCIIGAIIMIRRR